MAELPTGRRVRNVAQLAAWQAYLPLAQATQVVLLVVVRTTGPPQRIVPAIEAAVHDADPTLPVYDARTLEQVIDRGVGRQRLLMVLLLGFGALALLIAAIGVFGVTAYAVSQRTHEISLIPDSGTILAFPTPK